MRVGHEQIGLGAVLRRDLDPLLGAGHVPELVAQQGHALVERFAQHLAQRRRLLGAGGLARTLAQGALADRGIGHEAAQGREGLGPALARCLGARQAAAAHEFGAQQWSQAVQSLTPAAQWKLGETAGLLLVQHPWVELVVGRGGRVQAAAAHRAETVTAAGDLARCQGNAPGKALTFLQHEHVGVAPRHLEHDAGGRLVDEPLRRAEVQRHHAVELELLGPQQVAADPGREQALKAVVGVAAQSLPADEQRGLRWPVRQHEVTHALDEQCRGRLVGKGPAQGAGREGGPQVTQDLGQHQPFHQRFAGGAAGTEAGAAAGAPSTARA